MGVNAAGTCFIPTGRKIPRRAHGPAAGQAPRGAPAEALARYGRPEIFNTDQGAQFTSDAFTGVLEAAGVQISIDGKGRCLDNIFIERLWRTVKYEYLYLHAFEGGQDLRRGLSSWVEWYNQKRPHQGLGYCTPDEMYYGELEPLSEIA